MTRGGEGTSPHPAGTAAPAGRPAQGSADAHRGPSAGEALTPDLRDFLPANPGNRPIPLASDLQEAAPATRDAAPIPEGRTRPGALGAGSGT